MSSSLGPSPPAIFLARPGGFLQFRLEAFPKFNISLRVHCTAQFENEREYLFLCRPGVFSRQKLLGCKKSTMGGDEFRNQFIDVKATISNTQLVSFHFFSHLQFSTSILQILIHRRKNPKQKEGRLVYTESRSFYCYCYSCAFFRHTVVVGCWIGVLFFFPETSRIVVAVDPANTQKILRRRLVFLLLCTRSFR